MNNKGFIATSILYSFFIVFLGLFLGVIREYLQDKILLNSIEVGIKRDLNTSMSINDFKVGDKIAFKEGFDSNNISIDCGDTDDCSFGDIAPTNPGEVFLVNEEDYVLQVKIKNSEFYISFNDSSIKVTKEINNKGVIVITGVVS